MCDLGIDEMEREEDFKALLWLMDDSKSMYEDHTSKTKKSLSEYSQALLKRFGRVEEDTNEP